MEDTGDETKKLDIVSACVIAYGEVLLPTLTKVNEVLLINNEEENESFLCPFKAMDYGCRFNLAPIGYEEPTMNLVTLALSQMMIKFNSNTMDERSSLI